MCGVVIIIKQSSVDRQNCHQHKLCKKLSKNSIFCSLFSSSFSPRFSITLLYISSSFVSLFSSNLYMTLNYKHLLIFGVFSSLLTILFVGQFYDHHGDKNIFIKNRPSFRQIFSFPPKNPLPATSQDADKKVKEIENENFVLKQMEKESDGALFIASVLIQISIMLIIAGCFSFFKKTSLSLRQLIILNSINLLITFFAVSFMLFIDNTTTSIILFLVIVITNYLTIIIHNRLFNHSQP
jgi:hypothetical protein